MSTRKRPTPRTTARSTRPQGRAHCLNILRQLSAYLDEDLQRSVCDEIRRHLGTCPNCELFVDSLRQTVSLCRHTAPPPLSASSKAQLRQRILQAGRTQ